MLLIGEQSRWNNTAHALISWLVLPLSHYQMQVDFFKLLVAYATVKNYTSNKTCFYKKRNDKCKKLNSINSIWWSDLLFQTEHYLNLPKIFLSFWFKWIKSACGLMLFLINLGNVPKLQQCIQTNPMLFGLDIFIPRKRALQTNKKFLKMLMPFKQR